MRAVIVTVFLASVLVTGLLVSETSRVSADTHSPPKQSQWQYQCFEATGVAQVTEQANKMGEQGWELVTSAGTTGSTLWCFKRPLWKKPK